jgi:hypothetical protein
MSLLDLINTGSARVYTNHVLTNKNLDRLIPFLDDDDEDAMTLDPAMVVYSSSVCVYEGGGARQWHSPSLRAPWKLVLLRLGHAPANLNLQTFYRRLRQGPTYHESSRPPPIRALRGEVTGLSLQPFPFRSTQH